MGEGNEQTQMKIEYVDPPVENDELSVWRNYRQIKCCVKDGNVKMESILSCGDLITRILSDVCMLNAEAEIQIRRNALVKKANTQYRDLVRVGKALIQLRQS